MMLTTLTPDQWVAIGLLTLTCLTVLLTPRGSMHRQAAALRRAWLA
jgi:hypothetical protein